MAIQRAVLDCFAALAMTVALLFATPVAAQTFPKLTGRVVDQANLLAPEQELDLTSKSQALEAQSGRQFVVATVASLEGREIEDYGGRLLRQWRIGREQEDDGVILLVAPNEKKVRIETGYGAEGFLPDILGGRIIRTEILPRFRKGDMAGGVMAGADAIIRQMSLPPEEAQQQAQQAQERARAERESLNIAPLVFWGMIILFVLLSMSRGVRGQRYRARGYRRRGRGFDSGDFAIVLWGLDALSRSGGSRGAWGGGGGFGGFGGGGGGFGGFSGLGGSGGGGGASGSW